jgi:hypothetical protein
VRFDELSLRIPGDELRMRFHDRLTVLTGIGALERQALIEGLLGTLTGTARQSTVLTYVDDGGRRVSVTRDEVTRAVTSTYVDDGSPAPDLMGVLKLDFPALSQLCRITASEIGLLAPAAVENETPELAEARATLRVQTDELEAAMAARDAVEAMRQELADLDEQIRDYDDHQARRRYARLLAELERVRAEAAAIRGGEAQAEADRRFLAKSQDAHRLADEWRRAATELERARASWGERDRLDPRTLAEAEEVPESVPDELDTLVTALEAAEARRDQLNARLQELAAKELPEPSSPDVIRLAHGDQESVWAAARAVLSTEQALERASLDLGGLPAEGTVSALAEQLEEVHQLVDQAERTLEERRRKGVIGACLAGIASAGGMFVFLPLTIVFLVAALAIGVWGSVLPRRQLRTAQRVEDAVLAKAGIGTYLGFHIRRIDATIDPAARERLNVTALEHRVAQSHWHEIGGGIDPDDALRLEDEVRSYTAALATLDGRADEIESVRRQLVNEAEPAVAWAHAQLMEACAPYGVDDPKIAAGMVRHQVQIGRTARLQRELEAAESAATAADRAVDAMLTDLGFAAPERRGADGLSGDVEARVGALDVALAAAKERSSARTAARPRDVVEAELADLESRARREHRAEWGTTVAASDDADLVDVDELRARRDATASAYETASRVVPDIDRLVDRRSAVERRVNVLETQSRIDAFIDDDSSTVPDIEKYLLARISSVRSVGGVASGSAGMPLILDEPFVNIRGERKWELLDLIERVSKSAQLVYFSNDPDVQLWARRRAASQSLLLLEPAPANAPA